MCYVGKISKDNKAWVYESILEQMLGGIGIVRNMVCCFELLITQFIAVQPLGLNKLLEE